MNYKFFNELRQGLIAADQLLQAAAHHHGRGDPLAAHAQMERALKRVEAAHSLIQAAVQGPPAPQAGAEEAPPA